MRLYLKKNKMKQVDMARILGITPPAVSQMLAGKIMPSQQGFTLIAEHLRLPSDEYERLQMILFGIRAGMPHMLSSLNCRLRALRCKYGFTPKELQNLSGISESRLSQLENHPDAVPTREESEALSAIFKEAIGESDPEYPSAANGSGIIECREGSDDFSGFDRSASVQLMQVRPECFSEFEGPGTLGEFEQRRQ